MSRAVSLAAIFLAACASVSGRAAPVSSTPPGEVHAMILGIAQDGGVPHLGCTRPACEIARKDPSRRGRVASLGLVSRPPGGETRAYLIDATPDMRSQIDSLLGDEARKARPRSLPVDGIFLTHAHIGHYTGLLFLGKESISSRLVPVHATRRMADFLRGSRPWSRLLADGNIELHGLVPGRRVALPGGLEVEPLRVPHREEASDVVGYIVTGPSRRLLYIPDIDSWSRWERDIAELVETVDIALLDATFYSADELPGRSMENIPHPLVTDTMSRLRPLVEKGRRVILIHLNHTNPALDPRGPQRREVEERGFEVARDGLVIPL